LLHTLPETRERHQQTVAIYLALGASLLATQGYAAPEVGETYTSARQLCQALEDPSQLFPVLHGLWAHSIVCADLQTAHALSAQLLPLAQQAQEPAMLGAAHAALGATLYHLGAVAAAYRHSAQGIALYDPQQQRASAFLYGQDAGVLCHGYTARELWSLGFPDQGLAQNAAAVTLAQQIAHPFSLGSALRFAAMFHQLRREVRVAQDRADAAITLATAQDFPNWRAFGTVLRGWALAHQGQAQEGSAQISQGLRAWRATGAEIQRPHFLALLAEAYGMMGQPEAGLTALTEALTLVDTTGERYYAAEIYRLKGVLLFQQHADNQAEAATCFQHAISIAQNQSAKSWELRVATSLARLWHQQGKRQEAHDLLAPVYNWFTEGFDTADLMDAKALLDELV
jgi:predicted ATPase